MKSEYSGVIERIINMVLPFGIYFVFHLIVTPVSFLLAKSEEAAVEVHSVVLLLIYVISRLIFEWKNDKKLSYYYEDN